ncbi:MarR family winged helix-turn-helix transcriptional regulator [Portibacter lacus]|uniref:MarR family transcriptional regulator n=1 Tax=Portibacter lacus TaxID=1099794 RepID=A0AA37ST88_9BACT|nr:MarR family transcriptional regulator [Portibacter lacus]GLR19807.1 MarR family transcriptional regulator [Portibacter lacus]
MRLEEEINQKTFNSEHQKLILNLMYTYSWIEKPLKDTMAKEQLTMPQYNILRILKGAHPNPVSPQDVKKVMLNKKSDLTRLLDRLVSKEIIGRRICPSNRRKMDLSITEKGIDLLERLNPRIKEVFEVRISDNISAEEAKQANDIIDKMRG